MTVAGGAPKENTADNADIDIIQEMKVGRTPRKKTMIKSPSNGRIVDLKTIYGPQINNGKQELLPSLSRKRISLSKTIESKGVVGVKRERRNRTVLRPLLDDSTYQVKLKDSSKWQRSVNEESLKNFGNFSASKADLHEKQDSSPAADEVQEVSIRKTVHQNNFIKTVEEDLYNDFKREDFVIVPDSDEESDESQGHEGSFGAATPLALLQDDILEQNLSPKN